MDSVQVQKENGVQASIFNVTKSPMTMSRSINWIGVPVPFPTTIPANTPIVFNNFSEGYVGSSTAVVYTGFNNTMQPCAWVLAWDAPAGPTHNSDKVYVTCGLQADIDKLTFPEIRSLLDKSKIDSAKEDPVSKAKASAHIRGVVPNHAAVGSSFALMP